MSLERAHSLSMGRELLGLVMLHCKEESVKGVCPSCGYCWVGRGRMGHVLVGGICFCFLCFENKGVDLKESNVAFVLSSV